LDQAAKELFMEAFCFYPYWQQMKKKVKGEGNYHSVKGGEPYKRLISTYDMSVKEFLRAVETK
jgi:hypothetical protein